MSIGVLRLEETASALSARSRDALDRPLRHDAELVLARPSDEAVVLGGLQRASELGESVDDATRLVRRGSGGAEARVGAGTLWLQLSLARPNVLVACEPSRLLNRYVRPLLRALSKAGALTHYFDRDWLSAGKRPVGAISFAHDSETGRALVEMIVAVNTPFAIRERASYLGKTPATLAELGGAPIDLRHLGDLVIEAYGTAFTQAMIPLSDGAPASSSSREDDPRLDLPWVASRSEAVGIVAAGRDREGRVRVGGELMASRDALRRLEERVAEGGLDAAAIGLAIDETLGAPGVALLGIRSLTSVRDVLVDALHPR